MLLAREGSGRSYIGQRGGGVRWWPVWPLMDDGHRCTSLPPSHEWGGDKAVVLEAQWRTRHTAAEGLGTDHCSNGD